MKYTILYKLLAVGLAIAGYFSHPAYYVAAIVVGLVQCIGFGRSGRNEILEIY